MKKLLTGQSKTLMLFLLSLAMNILIPSFQLHAQEVDECAKARFLDQFRIRFLSKAEDYFVIKDSDIKIRGRLGDKVKCEVVISYYDLPCYHEFKNKLNNLAEFYPNVRNSWKVQKLIGAALAGISSSPAGKFVYIVNGKSEISDIESRGDDRNSMNAQVVASAAACSFGKRDEKEFIKEMKEYSGADGIQ